MQSIEKVKYLIFFYFLFYFFSTRDRVKQVNISVPPLSGCLWLKCDADFILLYKIIRISAAG